MLLMRYFVLRFRYKNKTFVLKVTPRLDLYLITLLTAATTKPLLRSKYNELPTFFALTHLQTNPRIRLKRPLSSLLIIQHYPTLRISFTSILTCCTHQIVVEMQGATAFDLAAFRLSMIALLRNLSIIRELLRACAKRTGKNNKKLVG